MSTHGPIESAHRARMNALAKVIDDALNGPERPRKVAFTLLVTEFGQIESGRVNYISNGSREDMAVMLKELLARFEGRHPDETAAGGPKVRQ